MKPIFYVFKAKGNYDSFFISILLLMIVLFYSNILINLFRYTEIKLAFVKLSLFFIFRNFSEICQKIWPIFKKYHADLYSLNIIFD